MHQSGQYVGQRLSLKGQACTVRYIGSVEEKQGHWLGVEWDDPTRGKHDGTHEDFRYFTCRSRSSTAASFLRPTQPWDRPRTFLQALREKYFRTENAASAEVIYVSRNKQMEEIGFEKFALRQAELRGIHVLVLDRMRIQHPSSSSDSESIKKICSEITDLDLSGNLFEKLTEILSLCSNFPRLRSLTLDGNRFSVNVDTDRSITLAGVRNVSLSRTLLPVSETLSVLKAFPSIDRLTFADNEIDRWKSSGLPLTLQTLDLTNNEIDTLEAIRELSVLPNLQTLIVKHNRVRQACAQVAGATVTHSISIKELDLGSNVISNWTAINELPVMYPSLTHLRVSGNPLYHELLSADHKKLTPEDGYMLTLARLPSLETLDYSKITEKERLNAEVFYLSQIATEISQVPAGDQQDIIRQHPRWQALCAEYGEPKIERGGQEEKINPNSLAARLVTITFSLADQGFSDVSPRSWTEELPRSLNIYTIHGLVGQKLGIMPLKTRLTWETEERDPAGKHGGYDGPEWWDSSDEEASVGDGATVWINREVQLVPGTRALGTYIDGNEAKVRVEFRDA